MGPCVSAGDELARFALAGGIDVRSSIQGRLGMEQVSMPSGSEAGSSQQGPGISEGSQAAAPYPSSPSLACTILIAAIAAVSARRILWPIVTAWNPASLAC